MSTTLYHAFFVLECRNDRRIEDAENQAIRGGAAIVYAKRMFITIPDRAEALPSSDLWSPADLNAALDLPHTLNSDVEGKADVDSVAVSLPLVPSLAHLYVHWAEITSTETNVVYHISLVKPYALLIDADLKGLRYDMSNILDWGTLARKEEIKKRMAEVKVRTEAGANRPRIA